ncbi:hypothetical protein H7Y21_00065 [Arenimonas sp.]|nr:hypothetical protein [Candidatus Parcubacteria bacterium]
MKSTSKTIISPMTEAIINFTNSLYTPTCMELITKEEIRDALSSGQLLSKLWLLDKFQIIFEKNPEIKKLDTVVVGGWLGLLARALNHLDERIVADSVDISLSATTIACLTLDNCPGTAILSDMMLLDYSKYNCVINTSSEHLSDITSWSQKINKGSLVIVQNNNGKEIQDHISCVDSSLELEKILNLDEIYYSDEIIFPFYTRFMVIGKK